MTKLLISFLIMVVCCVPAATAGDTAGTDFDREVSSFTNPVRAYPLRLKSLEELVKAYPDKAYSIILSLFKDPRESLPLRYQAARALSGINPKKTERVFLEILGNPKEDPAGRRMAMTELVERNSPTVRKKILGALDDKKEDPALRQYALGIFGSWKDEPNRIERLREFVQSKSETLSVRTNALFLLESSGDLDFVRSSVHQFLEDRRESDDLRKNCVLIAGRLPDETLASALSSIAQDSHESSALRQLALVTLGQKKDSAQTSVQAKR